jgi:ferrochelatase
MTEETPRAGGRAGVLLVAHGTVKSEAELPEFLLRIRRGRPVPPALLAEMQHRYRAIGGSPLLTLTQAQADALAAHLELPVAVGMRLWDPPIEQGLRELAERGARRIVVLPLAPFSVGVYHDAAVRAASTAELPAGTELVSVEPWGLEPCFVEAHVERLRQARERHPNAALLVTAHSLPLAVLRTGDRYADEVSATVQAIERAVAAPLTLAYQSQGNEGEWLGPDLRAALEEFARRGQREVVLSPVGFLAEHVETLFDLDFEAQRWAAELGLTLHRLPALNTDARFISALGAVVKRALQA